MPRLKLKDLPRYDCLVQASKQFPDLDPSACEAFMHVMRGGDDLAEVMNTHFMGHNITQGRFLVLMLLLDKGTDCPRPSTPADLADRASVSRATITGLLDTLERDGLVRREPDPTDRRQMSIHLTVAGVEFMHGFLPTHFRLINQLMGKLDAAERKSLVFLLNKLFDRPSAADQSATLPPPVA